MDTLRAVQSGVLAVALALAVGAAPADASPEPGYYACPPCGCADDEVQRDAAGACDRCGMTLVFRSHAIKQVKEVERIDAQAQRLNVAILVFQGVQIIDFTAPYEVFGQAGFRVFTVAESTDELTTAMGMKVVPSHTLADCPLPDIVVLPGGGGTRAARKSEAVLNWIRAQEKTSKAILTVCNGAFILAETGLLNGLEATTFYGLIPTLEAEAPEVRVVRNRRYVDNGKLITTAGLSSGIDGSLHVVSKILGKARAQQIALNMEYNWLDDVTYARADFADRLLLDAVVLSRRHLPYLDSPGTRWQVLDTRGDDQVWQVEWRVEGDVAASDLMTRFETKLTTDAKWTRAGETRSGDARLTAWRFKDGRERPWSGSLSIEPKDGVLSVRLEIRRNEAAG